MEIGSVVGGRYRVEAGGVGAVRFARDVASGRPVAVKLLAEPPGPAVRLRHPGIVTVIEVGEHEGRPFLAMERLDGYTLDDHLLDGPYGASEVAEFGAAIAQALVVAHRAGTSHGRLDADHVFRTSTGALKLLGLGTVPPPESPDLVALGHTLHHLLGNPDLPGAPGAPGGLAELSKLVVELQHAAPAPDPQLTEQFAARLHELPRPHRVARQPRTAEPAEQPRRPAEGSPFWSHRRPERLLLGRVLVAVICTLLLAVTAYAITATV